MRIKKDKIEEFTTWVAYMKSSGDIAAINFFESLCAYSEEGRDVIGFIYMMLKEEEHNRPHCMTNDDIYLAMRTFSDYHQMGDDFRHQWNEEIMGSGYADYIEEGKIKYLIRLFT